MHTQPDITFSQGEIMNFFDTQDKQLIITQKDIWEHVSSHFNPHPRRICFFESLDVKDLENLAETSQDFDAVIGVGGGRAADIAKYISWKNGMDLHQIPTIMSVDAFFTHEIAIRDNGVVRYTGDVVPKGIHVDYDIITSAPEALNRSGIGDIISCHTGMFDWQLSCHAGYGPPWNEELAAETRQLLKSLIDQIESVRDVTAEGIKTVMKALQWIGEQCYVQGHPRFEEGSEHFFVYNLEYLTGKNFVHGQAVCMGVLIMSVLQDNDPEIIRNALQESGICIHPHALGIYWEDVEQALLTLGDFVEREELYYSVINEKQPDSVLFSEIKNIIENMNNGL